MAIVHSSVVVDFQDPLHHFRPRCVIQNTAERTIGLLNRECGSGPAHHVSSSKRMHCSAPVRSSALRIWVQRDQGAGKQTSMALRTLTPF